MDPIFGTYHDGRVELDAPVDWPEGARLAVFPASESIGLDEALWDDSPEARAALAARIDALDPLDLTEEDRRAIQQARDESKQVSVEAVRRQMGLSS
jgi:hypothetical protein